MVFLIRPRPVPVLFIAGAGRSGSTFLDTVLGNHPSVGSYGEMSLLPRNGWLANGNCACGEPADGCAFWSEVRRVWLETPGNTGVVAYAALNDRFGRMRSWGGLMVELRRPSPAFQMYKAQTAALFRAVRDVSGRAWVVDSSKYGARAMILSRTQGIDLHVLHLVRDGRGVLSSVKSSYSTWRAALFWIRRNLVAEWARRRVTRDRSVRVRYEDLVRDPGRVLGEIGRLTGLEMADLAGALGRGEEMTVGHMIAGNERGRLKGRVRLQPDTGWAERLDPDDRRTFWLLAGWLLRWYGYRREGG
ncbi:sulfotransferase [soil metagenome]